MANAYLILAEVRPKLDLILPPYSLKGGTGLENGMELEKETKWKSRLPCCGDFVVGQTAELKRTAKKTETNAVTQQFWFRSLGH